MLTDDNNMLNNSNYFIILYSCVPQPNVIKIKIMSIYIKVFRIELDKTPNT